MPEPQRQAVSQREGRALVVRMPMRMEDALLRQAELEHNPASAVIRRMVSAYLRRGGTPRPSAASDDRGSAHVPWRCPAPLLQAMEQRLTPKTKLPDVVRAALQPLLKRKNR